jgi:competence protein ComGC
MRKIFRFSFEREAYWLVAICVVVPLLAILVLIVIPGLWRHWFP